MTRIRVSSQASVAHAWCEFGISLLPAIGFALIWFPVTRYLLATGAVSQGLVLLAYGSLVSVRISWSSILRDVGHPPQTQERRMMKHQLGLMLVLIILTFTPSPTEAALDEKSEILAEWLVDPEIETQSDLTTAHQRATSS